MWGQAKPQTEAERQEQIASLKARRDWLLAKAPQHFVMYRLVFTIGGVLMIAWMSTVVIFNPQKNSAGSLVLVVVFSAMIVWVLRGFWLNPPAPGDRWGMSDLIYHDPSPRDLQAEIDRRPSGK